VVQVRRSTVKNRTYFDKENNNDNNNNNNNNNTKTQYNIRLARLHPYNNIILGRQSLYGGLHVYWRAAVRSKGQKVLRTHNNNDGKSPPPPPRTSTVPL